SPLRSCLSLCIPATRELYPFPTRRSSDLYISDHTDIGLGLNAATKHPEEARKFLEWVGSPEFAELYANALPGFFSLNSTPVEMQDRKSTRLNSSHVKSLYAVF